MALLKRESLAIPKMCGIETECGVTEPNMDSAEANEQFVKRVNSDWIQDGYREVCWDATERLNEPGRQEEPGHFRPFKDGSWRRKSNRLLPNGARFYLDINHAEISAPLCPDPRSLLVWNRACYRWLDYFRQRFTECGKNFKVFRNNVATEEMSWQPKIPIKHRERISYACHLNILVSRSVSELDLRLFSIPWFILQNRIHGAGYVDRDGNYQISQRADFIETEADSATTYCRPIFNTRDVPYADRAKYRRVHIIPFDSNMLELPEYLKIALNCIFFMMVEDGKIDDRFALANPVRTFRALSRDLDLGAEVEFAGNRRARSGVDCLRDYCGMFWDYLDLYHPDNEVLKDAVCRFAWVLECFRAKDFNSLNGALDWVTKFYLIEGALEKKGKTWKDDIAHKLDTQYHDNDHQAGLFYRHIQYKPNTIRVASDGEIDKALRSIPPTRSRWITKAILEHYPEAVDSSDFWYRVSFKVPEKEKLQSLLFDPLAPWDEDLARELFSLPVGRFVEEAESRGLAEVEEHRSYSPPPISMRTERVYAWHKGSATCSLCLSGIYHNHGPLEWKETDDEAGFRWLVRQATRLNEELSFPQEEEKQEKKIISREPEIDDLERRSLGELDETGDT